MVSDSSSSTILKTAFVHCKANNVSRNTACDFVNSIIAIALLVLLQKPDLNIIITSLFAHDTNVKSTFRCTKSKRSSWWLLPSHERIFIFKWLLLNEKLDMHCYWVEDGSIVTGLLGWGWEYCYWVTGLRMEVLLLRYWVEDGSIVTVLLGWGWEYCYWVTGLRIFIF